ncbi:hypothetical protein L204_102004 [Cryptococcus depauperatus]|nr:hypothetical protein L204_05658 [Cryptococcus depauperatus CBS 7855]
MSQLQSNLDSDGFAVPAPPAKRQLRPAASQPTTSEIYGQRHGISADVQRALENVGRRGREAVARGHRSFDRTQSVPNVFMGDSATPKASFSTTADVMNHARRVINKEIMRAREPKPFGDISANPPFQPEMPAKDKEDDYERKLRFGPDGEVEEVVIGSASRKNRKSTRLGFMQSDNLVQNRKRRSSPAEPEDSDTETDDIDEDEPRAHVERGPFARFNSDQSVFPPVFNSSSISHPELYSPLPETDADKTLEVKPISSRQLKGLPGGRKLDWVKSASAPVVGLCNRGDMEVDGGHEQAQEETTTLEDGFEFNNWEELEF